MTWIHTRKRPGVRTRRFTDLEPGTESNVDLLLTITTAPSTGRISCTDDTHNRTEGTGCAGIPADPFHDPFHAPPGIIHDGTRAQRPGLLVNRDARGRGRAWSSREASPGPGPAGHGRLDGQMLMPGPWTRSVIHFAIGRRQEMATDCNEQPVIS